jgi:hypothetical protein
VFISQGYHILECIRLINQKTGLFDISYTAIYYFKKNTFSISPSLLNLRSMMDPRSGHFVQAISTGAIIHAVGDEELVCAAI